MIKAAEILSIPIYVTTQNRYRLGETCSELNIQKAVEHVDKYKHDQPTYQEN
jgi:thiamine-phosphate diphosphorylase/hydroxyethylthiazole kinase